IRSRSLCSKLSRQGLASSWRRSIAVLVFLMAYPPLAETSSEEIPALFSTASQENTPFTFLQESGQNPPPVSKHLRLHVPVRQVGKRVDVSPSQPVGRKTREPCG